MKYPKFGPKAVLLFAAIASLAVSASASVTSDATLQLEVQSKLKSKEFQQVTVKSNNGIVTLGGSVEKYQMKVNAEKKAKKIAGVKEVDDQIEVGGKNIADEKLQASLNRKLAYDRYGYGHVFNNITATVQDGKVTLDGEARWQPDKDSALALVSSQEGVKDVVDQIKVLPTSIYDDDLRARVFRAIYGDDMLGRYGADPASPIRIVVSNGHVALYGSVESQADKTIAFMRANGVSGAFSVENYLTVNKS